MTEFTQILNEMKELHEKKSADYASVDNPLSNFDVSTYILSLFKNPRDQAFVWPIATKLARLSTLLNNQYENSEAKPQNESIKDSVIDIANYTILWCVDIMKRKILYDHKKQLTINQERLEHEFNSAGSFTISLDCQNKTHNNCKMTNCSCSCHPGDF